MGLQIATLLVVASCAAPARASGQPAEPARAGRADRGNVYVPTIVERDTLIGLSRTLLAEPRRWPAIQHPNRVRNPRGIRRSTWPTGLTGDRFLVAL